MAEVRVLTVTPEYLNTEQAAVLTGHTAEALVMLRKKGDGPKYLKDGRNVRYRAVDLRAWMETWKEVAA